MEWSDEGIVLGVRRHGESSAIVELLTRGHGRHLGLVRGGAGTAVVGDPATVAARIREYQDVGIDTFIMSGYPHLEEAYRFAELVFPLLSLEQPNNVTPLAVNTGPFGETIANEHRPLVKASQS